MKLRALFTLALSSAAGCGQLLASGDGDEARPRPSHVADAGAASVDGSASAESASDGSAPGDSSSSDTTAGPPPKRVFVTSVTFFGNEIGQFLPGICEKTGVTGTFTAWIYSSQRDDRAELGGGGPWFLVAPAGKTAVKIADGYDDLLNGTLLSPINRDESGNDVASTWVWTGVDQTNHCQDWTQSAPHEARVGSTTATTTWDDEGLVQCDGRFPVYCFER